MLLSMTGHGDAFVQEPGISVLVEVRTINNRYFKLSVRTDDRYVALESQLEEVVRRFVRRGTVQMDLRVDRESAADEFRLREDVLAVYLQQLQQVSRRLGFAVESLAGYVLALPGVADERMAKRIDLSSDWPLIERAVVQALERLALMRAEEGRAMAEDLRQNRRQISEQLDAVAELAPKVADNYQARLAERVNKLLSEYSVQVQPADLVREVGVYAERCGVAEEIVRLRCHLEQFDQFLEAPESSGRKLDFLTQEMFREANTIGSKANDAMMARHVIEIKAAIERVREMTQNVE